jgi:hypothetical protein
MTFAPTSASKSSNSARSILAKIVDSVLNEKFVGLQRSRRRTETPNYHPLLQVLRTGYVRRSIGSRQLVEALRPIHQHLEKCAVAVADGEGVSPCGETVYRIFAISRAFLYVMFLSGLKECFIGSNLSPVARPAVIAAYCLCHGVEWLVHIRLGSR